MKKLSIVVLAMAITTIGCSSLMYTDAESAIHGEWYVALATDNQRIVSMRFERDGRYGTVGCEFLGIDESGYYAVYSDQLVIPGADGYEDLYLTIYPTNDKNTVLLRHRDPAFVLTLHRQGEK